jgi:hypothetical protein
MNESIRKKNISYNPLFNAIVGKFDPIINKLLLVYILYSLSHKVINL